VLPCLVFALEGTDLNQPPATRVRLLSDRFGFGGFDFGRLGLGRSDDRARLGGYDDDALSMLGLTGRSS
jgi:hypothetical protein